MGEAFKDRNKEAVGDVQSVRTSTAITYVFIKKIKEMLKKDKRLTLLKLSVRLNTSLESSRHNVSVKSGMTQLRTRWVLSALCDIQKQMCINISQKNLTLLRKPPIYYL